MKSYVIKMMKWGDPKYNSYLVGAFSSEFHARLLGKIEAVSRGYKYDFEITEIEAFDKDSVKINLFFRKKGPANKTNIVIREHQQEYQLEEGQFVEEFHLESSDHIELLLTELETLCEDLDKFSKEEQVFLKEMYQDYLDAKKYRSHNKSDLTELKIITKK